MTFKYHFIIAIASPSSPTAPRKTDQTILLFAKTPCQEFLKPLAEFALFSPTLFKKTLAFHSAGH
jgi:hypothetical protein